MPCAPIYDLLLGLATAADVRVERAILDGCPQGIGASLVFRREAGDVTLDCHPADALAIAVRARAPVYATPAALALSCPAHGRPTDGATARWLEAVRPSDFDHPRA